MWSYQNKIGQEKQINQRLRFNQELVWVQLGDRDLSECKLGISSIHIQDQRRERERERERGCHVIAPHWATSACQCHVAAPHWATSACQCHVAAPHWSTTPMWVPHTPYRWVLLMPCGITLLGHIGRQLTDH
jgi:hypothetical protein